MKALEATRQATAASCRSLQLPPGLVWILRQQLLNIMLCNSRQYLCSYHVSNCFMMCNSHLSLCRRLVSSYFIPWSATVTSDLCRCLRQWTQLHSMHRCLTFWNPTYTPPTEEKFVKQQMGATCAPQDWSFVGLAHSVQLQFREALQRQQLDLQIPPQPDLT